MSKRIVDDFKNKKPTNKLYKKCLACNGTGKDTPMLIMDPSHIIDGRYPKKRTTMFTCSKCGGSGQVRLFNFSI